MLKILINLKIMRKREKNHINTIIKTKLIKIPSTIKIHKVKNTKIQKIQKMIIKIPIQKNKNN